MLNQPTIEKLAHMKLYAMANAFRTQVESVDAQQLSFEERFALLVDEQFLWRENRALERRLRSAKLKQKATIEDINYQHPRGLDRKLLRSLARSEWVRQKQNILLLGPAHVVNQNHLIPGSPPATSLSSCCRPGRCLSESPLLTGSA